MAALDSLLNLFTCNAGTFYPKNGLISLLTLDARSSYPYPLAWGNALWAYTAYRMHRSALPKPEQPGLVFSVIITFVFYTMPANLFTNWLILGRTPGALASTLVIPVHLVACALVEFVPGAYGLFSTTFMINFFDSFGVLDNVTTAFNFLGEAYDITGSPFTAILAAMVTNVGGGVARHFMTKGYVQGAATFDAALGFNVLWSAATNMLFYSLAVSSSCPKVETFDRKGRLVASETCAYADTLYVAMPLIAVVKNLLPVLKPLLLGSGKEKKQ